jgi:hypothetical protein
LIPLAVVVVNVNTTASEGEAEEFGGTLVPAGVVVPRASTAVKVAV